MRRLAGRSVSLYMGVLSCASPMAGTTTEPDVDMGVPPPPPPIEPEGSVRWVGRHDDSGPAAARMGWSGAGLVFRFDGTGAMVRMDDRGQYFTVLIDGVLQPPLVTSSGIRDYRVAPVLPPGKHTIEMYRRTEGKLGPTVVYDVRVEGELLPPPPATRRIEIVGDSITAGYGNEGTDPCDFSPGTENHYQTYGAIAARAVGAELHTVAWSRKGVVYNYGDHDMDEPLPELYERTIATESATWSFEWQPDVVIVNLGTNDFSTGNDPPQALFVGAYAEFLGNLREFYPEAFQLVLQPSMLGIEVEKVREYLMEVVAQRRAAGDFNVAYADVNVEPVGSGCNEHPSVATHQLMAALLVEELQMHLGWMSDGK